MNALLCMTVVFSISASFVSLAWANSPTGKKAAQNSAVTSARLEQVEQDLVVAERDLEDYERRVNRYMNSLGCGTEFMQRANELKQARIRLKELENSKGDPTEVKAVKEKIAYCEGYFHEVNNRKVVEPLNIEEIVPRTMELRRKVADLIAQREKLKEKVPQAPAKKAP